MVAVEMLVTFAHSGVPEIVTATKEPFLMFDALVTSNTVELATVATVVPTAACSVPKMCRSRMRSTDSTAVAPEMSSPAEGVARIRRPRDTVVLSLWSPWTGCTAS